jgi:hypothetical protein
MTSDQSTAAQGRAEAVAAALRGNDPAIEVVGLQVSEGADATPVIQGRVGSVQDRQWALTLARGALGSDVHDRLEVDESLSSSAPVGVVSGFEDQGGTDPDVDWTQGAGAGRRRVRQAGEEDEHLGDAAAASEYIAPELEEDVDRDPGEAARPPA